MTPYESASSTSSGNVARLPSPFWLSNSAKAWLENTTPPVLPWRRIADCVAVPAVIELYDSR